ncbi:MAG: hypothetical protein EOO62_00675 [Hymenobacter sp.]|nr:MAG: hypothetical protein EOO62_00675 [Hymenobacter sp.]
MSSPNTPPGSDHQWEALLHQLRQHPPAEPQPFFYARVHARLLAQADSANTLLPKWLRKPAYAAALCALVLAVSGDGAVATPAGAGLRPGNPTPQVAR